VFGVMRVGGNHFKEEEEIFPLAQECMNASQRGDSASEYFNLCENFLR